MNAVTIASERVLVPITVPNPMPDTSPPMLEAEDATLSIETVIIRAETVTSVLEDILRSQCTDYWRNQ